MEAYCETVNPIDYVECVIWRSGRPTRAKIKELHRNWFHDGRRWWSTWRHGR